jgi:membrane protein involved in colicin uptake
VESYRQARDKAAALYFSSGKEEALSKQAAAEEKMDKDNQKQVAAEAAAKEESQAEKKSEEESKQAEEEKIKKEEEEKRKLENQQKLNDQKNAIDLENKGNELLAEEKYESAITYYQTAKTIYIRLELYELADGINDKIAAAKAGIKTMDQKTSESDSGTGTRNGVTGKYGPGVDR